MSQKYYCGCTPSKLDGTEYNFNEVFDELPEEYNYITVMPPVRNQGQTSKCVCYSITACMDWRKNLNENDNNGI